MIAFVPELHRLSILWEMFDFIPRYSLRIVEPYWMSEVVEKSTQSISSLRSGYCLNMLTQGSHARSRRDVDESFLNFPLMPVTIPTSDKCD